MTGLEGDDGEFERQTKTLAYFFSGGPHITDQAAEKAKQLLSDDPFPAKRNLLKELGLEDGVAREEHGREMER